MGIAGGVINTPVLKMFGYPIKVAIGCSAAIGFIIALIGGYGFCQFQEAILILTFH